MADLDKTGIPLENQNRKLGNSKQDFFTCKFKLMYYFQKNNDM